MLPLAALLPLALASPAGVASASPAGSGASSTTDFDGPARVRSGIALGLHLGLGVGGASGYPNDSQDIGNPSDYSASGWMLGTSTTLTIMGALADYVNFGFWFGSATYRRGPWRSTGGGLGLRVEVFPFTRPYPSLAGLGLMAQFGVGFANLTSTVAGVPEASGTQSFAATGVFHEWSVGHFAGGHFALGPSLEYDAMWSVPFERHGLVATARIVFYGGP